MKKFIFTGNENDKLTKKWKLKQRKRYLVDIKKKDGQVIALIYSPVGVVVCPYDSMQSFQKNWV